MIADSVIDIVNDTVNFQNDDLCNEMIYTGAPPSYYKHIKLFAHRRAGFTTAALRLLDRYTSTLIVTPSHVIKNYYRRMAFDEGLSPSVQEYIDDHIIPESFIDHRWICAHRPEQRHQLIILDPASMIEKRRGPNEMNRLRDELFMICDVLVELG